jgi:DNA topoisomerase IB
MRTGTAALFLVRSYAEDNFDESKHPRRDDGKFGTGGGGGDKKSDSKKSEGKTVTSEKHGEGKVLTKEDLAKSLPKDKNGRQGYGGFPLDTINKVHEFSGETGLKAVIFRKDRNGKEVQTYQYTNEHMQQHADAKFTKAIKMSENIDILRKRTESDSKSSDKKISDAAVVVRLIDTTTIRVGGSDSEKDTGSVGATTLRAEHVIKNSDGSVNLKFPGKSHKEWNRRIEGDLAKEILKRSEGKQPGDRLFGVSASDVNGYLEKASPDKITAKDFRTFHASSMCFDVLSKSAPPPKISAKEADAIIKKAVEETSKFLGNTPAICKEKYINPRVIDAYRNRVIEGKAA